MNIITILIIISLPYIIDGGPVFQENDFDTLGNISHTQIENHTVKKDDNFTIDLITNLNYSKITNEIPETELDNFGNITKKEINNRIESNKILSNMSSTKQPKIVQNEKHLESTNAQKNDNYSKPIPNTAHIAQAKENLTQVTPKQITQIIIQQKTMEKVLKPHKF